MKRILKIAAALAVGFAIAAAHAQAPEKKKP